MPIDWSLAQNFPKPADFFASYQQGVQTAQQQQAVQMQRAYLSQAAQALASGDPVKAAEFKSLLESDGAKTLAGIPGQQATTQGTQIANTNLLNVNRGYLAHGYMTALQSGGPDAARSYLTNNHDALISTGFNDDQIQHAIANPTDPAVLGTVQAMIDSAYSPNDQAKNANEAVTAQAAATSANAAMQNASFKTAAPGDRVFINGGAAGTAGAPPTTSATPASVPTGTSDINAITANSESNNRDFKPNGAPVTSSVGAKYAMQVMPATAANPGYGITPTQNDSPEEYDRVGRELLGKLAQKYNGDMQKTWAAYNWGAGRVDRFAARFGDNWLSRAPAAVQAYVNKNMSAYQGGSQAAGPQGAQVYSAVVQTGSPNGLAGGAQATPAATSAPQNLGSGWQQVGGNTPIYQQYKDAQGNTVQRNTATGETTVIEKANENINPLSPDAASPLIDRVIMFGPSAAGGGGMGGGQERTTQVLNGVPARLKQLYLPEHSLTAIQNQVSADDKNLGSLKNQLKVIGNSYDAASGHAAQLIQYLRQSPGNHTLAPANSVANAYGHFTNNIPQGQYLGVVQNFQSEVGRVITTNANGGQQQLTDESQRKLDMLKDPEVSTDLKIKIIEAAQKQMDTKMGATSQDIGQIQRRQAGGLPSYAAWYRSQYGSIPTATGKNGQKLGLINGQWVAF